MFTDTSWLPPYSRGDRQVQNTSVNLSVTLVWMDPPTLTFAGRQLVHDLDLVVLPSGNGEPAFQRGAHMSV